MTLTTALAALHRAGRIASPWLPGMATDHHVMVVESRHDGFPGLIRVAHDEGVDWVWPSADLPDFQPFPLDPDSVGPIGEPDLTDPATVGCLLALLREAGGCDRCWAEYCEDLGGTPDRSAWELGWAGWSGHQLPTVSAASEGLALQAALIALAEALP